MNYLTYAGFASIRPFNSSWLNCIVGFFGVVDCDWLNDDAKRIKRYVFSCVIYRDNSKK